MEAQTRYAKSGDVHIAYRVFGDGPRDIVLIPGTLSHVELSWEMPFNEHLLKRLIAFARVIVFDKRGQGLSDRVAEQTLEERIGDVRAVMDAAESDRATVYGWSEGGAMSLMFAATYPERTSALVLYGTFVSVKSAPLSVSPAQYERILREWETHWGEGILLAVNAPSALKDEAMVQRVAQLERASASPGSILALMRFNYEIDVRHLLPSVRVPTLILHRVGDALVPVAAGRYLAEHIPGARYLEIPGIDHLVVDNETQDVIADEIEEFLTGVRPAPEPDRVLATVLFTDIVGSTEQTAEMGDRRWHALLDNHNKIAHQEITRFRGREIKSTGDGVLATFDGPGRGVRCARAICDSVKPLGIEVRAGLHTGECELMGDDIGGIAVVIAARVAARAGAGEVLVSSTVKDLVAGSGIEFEDRGSQALKGVPDEWRLFLARA
ncbi:MAG: adenylate/guanylate cyclase domain-containing protein [Dehalococcoidia bacterium]